MKGESLRVTLFMPDLSGGGAERAMLNLAEGLSQRCNVELVLTRFAGKYLEEAKAKTISLVDLKARRPRYSLPAFAQYIWTRKPHVVIATLETPSVFAALTKQVMGSSAYKLIISEQNTPSKHYSNQKDPFLRSFPAWARFPYRWADKIVAVSNEVAEDTLRTYRLLPQKVLTIYNPVITPSFWTRRKAPSEHPFYKMQEPILVAAGRLTLQKDFATLLRAFRLVLEQKKARLIIFGEGPERSRLEALVKSWNLSEYVSLPGFVKNLPTHMAQANLFVLSSKWEGLPTVLIEAIASGVPVVATDCPSGPREILEEGRWGKLVPVGDVSALAKAILDQLANPIFPSKEAWRRFTLDEILDQWLSLIMELCHIKCLD